MAIHRRCCVFAAVNVVAVIVAGGGGDDGSSLGWRITAFFIAVLAGRGDFRLLRSVRAGSVPVPCQGRDP
jgi:hypothetical protein